LCSLVSFQHPGDHRDLHSFPTRRSSDLTPSRSAISCHDQPSERAFSTCSASRRSASTRSDRTARRPTSGSVLLAASMSTGSMARSEEHTSELQSRENLVCRLLLEKKKKK